MEAESYHAASASTGLEVARFLLELERGKRGSESHNNRHCTEYPRAERQARFNLLGRDAIASSS